MDVNGVTCIKGEIHSLMTLMRLNTRWAAPSRFSRELLIQDESPLIQSFRRLNEYLEDTYDLRDVDCVVYLDPFLQVVISEHASGPLTSAALSSLNKFALYGFLSSDMPRASEGINLAAHSISSCVFEETDWESDEIILVKLLELSSTCLRCEASSMLTVSSAWDIFSTCLSIHGQIRASKLLRSEAETALRHLTLTAFSKAEAVIVRTHPPTGAAAAVATAPISTEDEGEDEAEGEKEADVATGNVLQAKISTAAGLTVFLRKIMSVLTEIMDPQSQPPENIKFALTLVNIALEAGGPLLGSLRPLVDILRGDVCRHLLRTSQSDDMAIFSLALRVVFNLFSSIKDHMKVQLEVFLTSVHLRLLNSSSFSTNPSNGALVAATPATGPSGSTGDPNGSSISLAKEELALESLLEFCREPSLMHDLYTNYDCDVQCTNLFDSIITTLCARAKPSGTQAYFQAVADTTSVQNSTDGMPINSRYVNILNRLSFEGVLLVLHAVAVRCWSSVNTGVPRKKSGQNLAKHAAPHKQKSDPNMSLKISGSANNLIDENDYSPHSPISTNSELSSMTCRVPTDLLARPHVDRSASNSTIDHSYYNDDGFTSDPDNEDEDENDFLLMARLKTAEVLRQRKIKKQKIRLIAEKFNEKPLNGAWVRFASDLGLLPKIPATAVEGKGGANLVDAKSMAKFLKTTAGLDKACVGEFLSKGPKEIYPYHAEVLREYVNTFDFWNKGKAKSGTFVKSLRIFLGQFRLPGEAQCIDRLMEAFANRLYDQLGPNNPFVSSDAAFILAFSTIMLNTDQHNPGIPDKKRMKKEEFIRNNRGINGNADLPLEYLEALYDEIKQRQIQVDHGISDQAGENAVDIISDTQHWDKLIRRAAEDQTPASFTPTVAARRYKRGSISKSGNGGLVGLGSHSFRIRDRAEVDRDLTSMHASDNIDDNVSVASLSEGCPASIHDGDMFQVMAQPVLDTLNAVWETTEDPQLICRIVEGVWDYASICAVLNFPEQFNKLIRTLAEKSRVLIDEGSEDVLSDIFNDGPAKTEIGRGLPADKRDILKKNVKRLVRADFDTIISSRKKNAHNLMYQLVDRHRQQHIQRGGSPFVSGEGPEKEAAASSSPELSASSDDISWEGSQYMRGQLLLRVLFHVCNKYISFIGPAGWTSLVRVLLWCRRRGDLPDNLVEIDDFSDARGGSLDPSVYALRCYNGGVDKKKSTEKGGGSGSSLWSSVTSLWWASDGSDGDGNITDHSRGRVDIVGGRSHDRVNRSNESGAARNLPHHPLLKETMTASRVDALLFLRIRDLSEPVLISIVSCIIDELDGIYRYDCLEVLESKAKLVSTAIDDSNIGKDSPSNNSEASSAVVQPTSTDAINIPEMPRVISELDGVIIIEWVSRLMFANMHRTKAIWNRLHDFFATMLERHVEEATQHCPYMLERCAVAIIRAAIHLLHFSAPIAAAPGGTISGAGSASEGNLPTEPGEDSELIRAVWKSLRLLKGIPGEVVGNLADRLGAGLLTFIRGSPECSSIRTLEQWYLIFSLLSAISAGKGGRPYVWEAVGYLIDNNLITNLNFSPCRHLVLRFLYGVFPGEVDEESRLQSGLPQLSERNPWLTGSLVHLLRLALMACGGYEKDNSIEQNVGTPDFRTFPFEDSDEVSLLSVLNASPTSSSVVKGAGDTQGRAASGGKQTGGSVIKVVCVRFTHPEEVQLLLVETVKTFSDFVSVMPLAVSKHASFCLQVLLSSCKRVSLKSIVWASMLKEMINRLPLNYMKVAKLFEERSEPTEIDTLCLKSCNIAFEAITLNFRTLRGLDEFQNLWLSFLSLLALNINGLLELRLSDKLALLSEFVEMLVALLRFLVPEATLGANGTFTVKSRHVTPDGQAVEANGTTVFSACSDVMLLHLTWNSILGVCPGMTYCLKKNHSYMLEILGREPNRYVYPEEKKPEKIADNADSTRISEEIREISPTGSGNQVIVSEPKSVVEHGSREKRTDKGAATNCMRRSPDCKIASSPAPTVAPVSPSVASPSSEGGGDYSRMRKIDARTHIV